MYQIYAGLNFRIPIFLLLSIHLFPTILVGQAPAFREAKVSFDVELVDLNFKGEKGIFYRMVEDKEGFLWIAGSAGLHVFDGQQTITYGNGSQQYPLGPDSLSTKLDDIQLDMDQNLYISRKYQVQKFNTFQRSFEYVHFPQVKFKTETPRITLGIDGTPHVCYIGENFHPTIHQLHSPDSSEVFYQIPYSFANVTDVYFRPFQTENNYFILTQNELFRIELDGKQLNRYKLPEGNSTVSSRYKEEIYFLDAPQTAFWHWNATTDKIEKVLDLPIALQNRIDLFSLNENLLLTSGSGGLFILDLEKRTYQHMKTQISDLILEKKSGSLADEHVHSIVAQDGSFLVLTAGNLFRLRPKLEDPVAFQESIEGLEAPPSMRGITEDNNGNVFATFYSDLARKAKGEDNFKLFPIQYFGNPKMEIMFSLNFWNDRLLWNNAQVFINNGKFTPFNDGIPQAHIVQYLQADTLWYYPWYYNSFFECDLKNQTVREHPLRLYEDKGLNSGIINAILPDESGKNLWLAQHDFGIYLVSKTGETLKSFTNEADPDGFGAYDLYLEDQRLWFGGEKGLGFIDTNSDSVTLFNSAYIDENEHLSNRVIYSLVPDELGNFYLGSNYGLLYFDQSQKKFLELPAGHALSTLEFNRSSKFKDSSGKYYFGTTNGLYSFFPDDLQFSIVQDSINTLKLIGISIFNSLSKDSRYLHSNLNQLEELHLQASDTNLEFNFTVPDHQKDIYYSYRLKGINDQWTPYATDNSIYIYSLPPGKSRLEIKASASLDDANISLLAVDLYMDQVWYKKIWVLILFFLAGLGIIALVLRYRFNQELARQKELELLRTKISSDLHDDVGSILTGVAMQSELMGYQEGEGQKEKFQELSRMSREAMEKMRDTVWAIDARKDKYQDLISKMHNFAEQQLNIKHIKYKLEVEGINREKMITPLIRQNIYLIFKEAITNVVKHSSASEVHILLSESNNALLLKVRDNGDSIYKGSIAENPSSGLGLSNMKMRAERIGGKMQIEKEDGYEVILTLPV